MTPTGKILFKIIATPSNLTRSHSMESLTDGIENKSHTRRKCSVEHILRKTYERLAPLKCMPPQERTSIQTARFQRLLRREENLNWIASFLKTNTNYSIDEVTGWWNQDRTDGIHSEFDTITLISNNPEVTLTIKLDSSLESQKNHQLTRFELPSNSKVSEVNHAAELLSSQGLCILNSTESYLKGSKILSNPKTYSDINIKGAFKIPLASKISERANLAAANLKTNAFCKFVYGDDHWEKASNDLEKKLLALARLPEGSSARSNHCNWEVHPNHIQMSEFTGKTSSRNYFHSAIIKLAENNTKHWYELFRKAMAIPSLTAQQLKDLPKKKGNPFTLTIESEDGESLDYIIKNPNTRIGTIECVPVNSTATLEVEITDTQLIVGGSHLQLTDPKVQFKILSDDFGKISAFTTANEALGSNGFLQKLSSDGKGYEDPVPNFEERFGEIMIDPEVKTIQDFLESIKDKFALASSEQATELLVNLLERMHDMATISDHLGLCCPSCDEAKPEDFPKVAYKPPAIDSATTHISTKATTIQEFKDSLISINQCIFTQLGLPADKVLKDIHDWCTQLDDYQIEEEYKTAMRIEYLISLVDKIDAYYLTDALEASRKATITLIKTLSEQLLDQRDKILHPQNPLHKYRFSLTQTLSNALHLISDTGGLNANYKGLLQGITLKATEDEVRMLTEAAMAYNEPKHNQIDIAKVPFHQALRCGPIHVSIIAGKLGSGKTQLVDNCSDHEDESKSPEFTYVNGKLTRMIRNIEKESSDFDSDGTPREQLLVTIRKNKLQDFRTNNSLRSYDNEDQAEEIETYNRNATQLASRQQSDDKKSKIVGCACCSGRDLTALELSEIDRGYTGQATEAVILDSIGYADFNGMLTLPHERVMSRTFFKHAITQVNLNNPQWKHLYDTYRTAAADQDFYDEDRVFDIVKFSEEKLGTSFENVLLQQLHYATHINFNNFGHGGNSITVEQFKELYVAINGDKPYSTTSVSAIEKEIIRESDLKKIMVGSQISLNSDSTHIAEEHVIDLRTVVAEIDTLDSELDENYIQEDLKLERGHETDAHKQAVLTHMLSNIKDIDRAKGHFKINGTWFMFQISDGATFTIRTKTEKDGEWKESLHQTIKKPEDLQDYISKHSTKPPLN